MWVGILQFIGSVLKDILPFLFVKHEAEKAGKNEAQNEILRDTKSKLEEQLKEANDAPEVPYDGNADGIIDWVSGRETDNPDK